MLALLRQYRLLIAAALLTGGLAALWAFGDVRYRQGRADAVSEQRRIHIETRGRMDNADVGVGDSDDDARWMRERAGGR